MIDSIINCENLNKADALILSVAYGNGYLSKKNPAIGPCGVIPMLHREIELFNRFTKTEPAYLYKIAHKNVSGIEKLNTSGAISEIQKLYDKFSKKFIIMLGGDHIVTLGALRSFNSKKKNKKVSVLQIDAHPDLRDTDSDYKESSSQLGHGCIMRRAYDLDYNIINVGARTYSKVEYDFFKNNKRIKIFEWGGAKKHSIDSIIRSIKTRDVYLTIDIDGLDTAYAPATATPVPGGIKWGYLEKLLIELFKRKNVIGADIVEISPFRFDKTTLCSSAQICYNLIGYKFS